jgi:hypothetical protein
MIDKSFLEPADTRFDRSIMYREGKFIFKVSTIPVKIKHCPVHDGICIM